MCIRKSGEDGSSIDVINDWEQTGTRIISPKDKGFLPDNDTNWTELQLKRVHYHLIDVIENYRALSICKSIMQTTLKAFAMGIQSAFSTFLNYKIQLLNDPIFCYCKEGLLDVIDKKIRSLNAVLMHTVTQNLHSKEYFTQFSHRSFFQGIPA